MKTIFRLAAVAALLAAVPGRCFALWEIAPVSPDEAKKLGMEVRSNPAGPEAVRVVLEFKPEGQLKGFSHVDLRVGGGNNPLATAALKEERTKTGSVVVSFSADRAQLDKLVLWVMVRGGEGGVAYELRVKEFVGAN
ncbi:MAG: hypothetical protein ACJ8F7_08155 [Gemmataceae bacterium]